MQIRIGSRYDFGKCIYIVIKKNGLPTVRRIPGIALGGTEDIQIQIQIQHENIKDVFLAHATTSTLTQRRQAHTHAEPSTQLDPRTTTLGHLQTA